MREIKFRAWWKHPTYNPNGTMYFVGGMMFAKKQDGEPEYDMKETIVEVGLMGSEYNTKIGWNNGDECILMQYTGLKDKNGKEIYEGDIAKDGNYQSSHCLAGTHEVKFVDGAFFPFAVPGWECVMEADKSEVIGNVWENPELLTK